MCVSTMNREIGRGSCENKPRQIGAEEGSKYTKLQRRYSPLKGVTVTTETED